MICSTWFEFMRDHWEIQSSSFSIYSTEILVFLVFASLLSLQDPVLINLMICSTWFEFMMDHWETNSSSCSNFYSADKNWCSRHAAGAPIFWPFWTKSEIFLDMGTRALKSLFSYCFLAICKWLMILDHDKWQSSKLICTIASIFVSAYPLSTSFGRFTMGDKGKFWWTLIIRTPEYALDYLCAHHGRAPFVGSFWGKFRGPCSYWKVEHVKDFMEVFNSWYLSRKSLNRSIHALNGNPDRKKKGPGFHSIQNMINRSCNWLWSMVSSAEGWYLLILCLFFILASISNLMIYYLWVCSENRIWFSYQQSGF